LPDGGKEGIASLDRNNRREKMPTAFLVKECSFCGKEYPDDAAVCTVDGGVLIASASNAGTAAEFEACPSCGAVGASKARIQLRSSFSLPAFLLGGLFAVMFRNASRGQKMQCQKCGTVFVVRSSLSKVSRTLFWIIVTPPLVVLAAYLIHLLWSAFKGD
jgi:hypothetical protein